MKTVSCHRKYQITTNFLDTMLEHSVDIQEGESKLDAYRRGLKELDQIAAELRKEANPHLYQELGSTNIPEHPITGVNQFIKSTPTLNIEEERKEVMATIDKCATLEELKAWKSQNQTIPGKILTHYTKRFNELSNS